MRLKKYIPVLEAYYYPNDARDTALKQVTDVTALIVAGQDVEANTQLLTKAIIDYYTLSGGEPSMIDEPSILVNVRGNPDDHNSFSIEDLFLFRGEDDDGITLGEDAIQEIETGVNQNWEDDLTDQHHTKETEDELNNWINRGGY